MEPTTERSPFAPLETAPPTLPLEAAAAVAEAAFDVTGSASPLESERDLNLRIVSANGDCFVLKLSNRADDRQVLDLQTQAMLHIARHDPELPVMQPLLSRAGNFCEEVAGPDGTYLVRLFSFLPGKTVASREMEAAALEAFGATVARVGLALQGFSHPGAGYPILWDLKHTLQLRRVLSDIEDRKQRKIVEVVLERFEDRVAPRLADLSAQIIHNDLTLDNVLVDTSHRVSGIVDFGDLTHTALICDLAVALVSLMWGRSDPFEAAEAAISGYLSVREIEREEAEVIADLVAARLAALVAIAAWRVRRYPENAAYITANVELAWDLLSKMQGQSMAELQARLESACLSEPGSSSGGA
jgi:Ser/Thr protein kinase RdoA (MazF antagonist)